MRVKLFSTLALSCLSCGRCASIASVSIAMSRNLIKCPSSFFSSLTRNLRSLQICLKSPVNLFVASENVAEHGKMVRRISR